jgi:hypothetical protein
MQRLFPSAGGIPGAGRSKVNPEQVLEVSASVTSYLREQRDRYFPSGTPLNTRHTAVMQAYFPPTLLDRIRTVELNGARIPNPPFYSKARELGCANLPNFPHMASLTFQDVVVFNEDQILGLQRYSDLLVRPFLRS